MHGNVEEWCLDRYGDYPTSPVTDPVGPKTEVRRVIRDGSWSDSASYCRSAFRSASYPDFRNFDIGFRVALSKISNKGALTITINVSMQYDGTPLLCPYAFASASGLLPGDKLTNGFVSSTGSEIGSYSYPDTCTIMIPFETALGIENYDVTYNIKLTIIPNE